MSDQDSLASLLQRLDDGEEQAATEIFKRFAARLVGLAQSRLNRPERQKVDPEDIVQSVFRSFFVRQSQHKFELADWSDVWGLLIRMTIRKCGRRIENLRAACRDCRRDVPAASASDPSWNAWDLVTREPTSEEIVMLSETVEWLMSGLDELEKQIVTLRLEGHSAEAIAAQLGTISERKVYRVMAQIRKRFASLSVEE